MSSAEKAKFKREKTSGKRIDYNHKRREFGGENWLDQFDVGGEKSFWDKYKYLPSSKSPNTYEKVNVDKDHYAFNSSLGNKGDLKVQQYQKWLNENFNTYLDEDGIWGEKTENAYKKYVLEKQKPNIPNTDPGLLNNYDSKLSFKYDDKGNLQVKSGNKYEEDYQDWTNVEKLSPTLKEFKSLVDKIPSYNQYYEDVYDADPSLRGNQAGPVTQTRALQIENTKKYKPISDKNKEYIGKTFGTLPVVEVSGIYEGYSPNRIWTTPPATDSKPWLGDNEKYDPEKNPRYLYFITPKEGTKSADKKFTEQLEDLNCASGVCGDEYLNKSKTTYFDDISNQRFKKALKVKETIPGPTGETWKLGQQAYIEMLNNPEIIEYAKQKNIDLKNLSPKEAYSPLLAEALVANRDARFNNKDVVIPDSRYYSTVIQNPDAFNLAGYLPITLDMFSPNTDIQAQQKLLLNWDKASRESYLEKAGIPKDKWNDVYIHTSSFPIEEYTPGKKYGGWLSKYQDGGLSMGDYDLTTAPKRGDYLLPDINRPSYIDEAGNKRSEYRMGKNIDGRETLIPTVVGGKQLSEDEALDRYYKTGLHMGQFNTPEEADYASRLRTARYNMLEDPIRFQADQFQVGGRAPIYTSNPNDPRLRSYNDSLSLYNEYLKPAEINKTLKEIKNDSRFRYYRPSTRTELNSFPGKIKPILGTEFDFSRIDADLISGRSTKHNYYPTYDSSGRIMPGEIGTHLSFKKPVQPYIYRKPEVIPEVIETPVVPVPVVEPPKPSLFVSNIDRDMYTPGGGMGREYNIGVTLQDGSKKAFRTEKEYQDWKAANNLDISNAKVTEGKGYSYDYPENKKYGGWLDQFQTGGWANFVPASSTPLLRKDVSGNAGYRDNTRVNTINPATKKAAEAAEYAKRVGSISQGKTKSDYEKAREASSFVSQAEQRKGSADPLDYVLDIVNPATYGFAGTDLVGNTAMGVNNLAKGNFSEAAGNALNAGMNALYLLPAKGLAKTIASPMAFTPIEGMMYRGIGKEGFKDAVQSGVFRPKQLNYSPGRSLAERVATPKQFSRTYYAPAKKFGVVENYGPEYLAEVSFENNPFGKRYGRKDWSWSTSKEIPINEGRILKKDWLRGYKPVDVSSLQSISKPKNYFDEFDNLTYEGTTDLYESIPHPYYKGPVQEAVDLWQDYKYVSPELENAFTINTKSSVPVTRYLKEKPQFDEEGYLISKGPTSFAVGPGNKNFGENRIFLNIPENTRVAPISKGASNTNFQRERELLLPSNTKYRKVNSRINPETGLEDYYMEIVPKKQGGQTSWLNKYK
jgi:hypothetical protein